jgi:hypothetical protein
VRAPALWWPRDLGDQNRYRLRAKLADSERSVTTGICDISRVDNHLVVNGDPLPIRGINLLTASEEDVERALGVNANLVRAHAHVPPLSLYDACDQMGLLVWQDLPLTGPGAFDTDRGRQLAETISGTYSQHPSLAAYGVHDEPVEMVGDGGLGAGLVDGLRLRWRAWRNEYDHGPANTVAETLPGNRPVFPVIGEPGTDADAGAYYPGWDYGQPESIDTLLDRYPVPVVAEFGAGAFASETAESAAGFNRTKHDRRADDETSQSYQATVLRTVRNGSGAVMSALSRLRSVTPTPYGWVSPGPTVDQRPPVTHLPVRSNPSRCSSRTYLSERPRLSWSTTVPRSSRRRYTGRQDRKAGRSMP